MVNLGNTRTQFNVHAVHDPNTLPRVLELFAIRDLVYDSLSARKSNGGMQFIELSCLDIDAAQAELLMKKIRAIINVRTVKYETTVYAAPKLAA